MKNLDKSLFFAMLIGLIIGIIGFVSIRFINIKNDEVHYHANFALYIDGERYDFSDPSYYEEVQSCSGDELNNPKTRVHMHDMVNHVAHVHDNSATWGHLFANLGMVLGNDLVKAEDNHYISGQNGKKLSFLLNGQKTGAVANRTIANEDVLLINYGADDVSALQTRYDAIIKDAAEYNRRDDPSACSGGKPLTFLERLKRAVWFE